MCGDARSDLNNTQPIRIVLPTGMQMGSVNVYLFTEPEPILVDAGLKSPECWKALQEGLGAYGLTVKDLSRIIVTHAHIDHYGQAGTIVANSDANVWISDMGVPWLLAVVESPSAGETVRVPSLPLFMESLDLIEALDVELVLPGHGRPFRDHRQVIQRQRDRIIERKGECLGWVEAGISTLAGLLDKMYAHRRLEFRFAGLWMLVGYLDLLISEGAVEQRTIDRLWHYIPRVV